LLVVDLHKISFKMNMRFKRQVEILILRRQTF